MKKVFRLAFLLLLMCGSFSASVLADGGTPPPICDPTTDPTCKIVQFAAPTATSLLP